MLQGLKIKKETVLERCEICHQQDCYDAERNFCSRCNGSILVHQIRHTQPTPNRYLPRIATRVPFDPVWKGMVLGTALGRIATEVLLYYAFDASLGFGGGIAFYLIFSIYVFTLSIPIGFIFGILVGLIRSNILLYKARRTNAASSTDAISV